jgi:hypothetical protein
MTSKNLFLIDAEAEEIKQALEIQGLTQNQIRERWSQIALNFLKMGGQVRKVGMASDFRPLAEGEEDSPYYTLVTETGR